ncbi:MAG: hypothetical protein HKP12_05370 [Gammaproteobacteria bacterium]|nr:hypothetical protein [Gammaproteobacteria bacterium]
MGYTGTACNGNTIIIARFIIERAPFGSIRTSASPYFSPGSREQALDRARLSRQMDEPSLDL